MAASIAALLIIAAIPIIGTAAEIAVIPMIATMTAILIPTIAIQTFMKDVFKMRYLPRRHIFLTFCRFVWLKI